MNLVTNAHWIILPFMAVLSLVLIYRAYRYRHEPNSSLFDKFGLGALLVLSTLISTILLPLNLYLHAFVVITLNAGLFIVYWALYRMLMRAPLPKPVIARPEFLITVSITSISVIADLRRIALWLAQFPNKDMPSFHYPQWYTDYAVRRPVNLTLVAPAYWDTSAIFFFCYDIGPALLLGMIVTRYLKTLWQPSDRVYFARRVVCLVGFAIGALGTVVMASGVVAWMLGRNDLRIEASHFYQITKIAMFGLVIAGFLIQHTWVDVPLGLLDRLSAPRRQRQQELITYLHRKVIRIVPSVLLLVDDRLVDLDQLLSEISDARRLIWSHLPYVWLITPQKEAELIFQLLINQTVITEPGLFTPPPITSTNLISYTCAVAKHLQRLEAEHRAAAHLA